MPCATTEMHILDISGNPILDGDTKAILTVDGLKDVIQQKAQIPVLEQQLLLGSHILSSKDDLCAFLATTTERSITLVRVPPTVKVVVRVGCIWQEAPTWKSFFHEFKLFELDDIPCATLLKDVVRSVAHEISKLSDDVPDRSYLLEADVRRNVAEVRNALRVDDHNYLMQCVRLLMRETDEYPHPYWWDNDAWWKEMGLVPLSQLDQCRIEDLPVLDEGTRVVKVHLTHGAPHEFSSCKHLRKVISWYAFVCFIIAFVSFIIMVLAMVVKAGISLAWRCSWFLLTSLWSCPMVAQLRAFLFDLAKFCFWMLVLSGFQLFHFAEDALGSLATSLGGRLFMKLSFRVLLPSLLLGLVMVAWSSKHPGRLSTVQWVRAQTV